MRVMEAGAALTSDTAERQKWSVGLHLAPSQVLSVLTRLSAPREVAPKAPSVVGKADSALGNHWMR